jgi:hypothetical protein
MITLGQLINHRVTESLQKEPRHRDLRWAMLELFSYGLTELRRSHQVSLIRATYSPRMFRSRKGVLTYKRRLSENLEASASKYLSQLLYGGVR